MPNFNSIGSGVSEPQVAENCCLPITTVYALTCYTVISGKTLKLSALRVETDSRKNETERHDKEICLSRGNS